MYYNSIKEEMRVKDDVLTESDKQGMMKKFQSYLSKISESTDELSRSTSPVRLFQESMGIIRVAKGASTLLGVASFLVLVKFGPFMTAYSLIISGMFKIVSIATGTFAVKEDVGDKAKLSEDQTKKLKSGVADVVNNLEKSLGKAKSKYTKPEQKEKLAKTQNRLKKLKDKIS